MRILMIRLSAIGDVVRTLPALTCLRRAYPQAHIAWAVEEASRDILLDQPDLDETIVFPRRRLARALLHPGELGGAWAALGLFGHTLKDGRFDLVIDFQGTFKSGLMAKLTGAPRRVGLGRGHAREMAHIFYTETAVLPAGRQSRVDRSLALVAHLGVATEGATAQIPERAADAAYIETFLAGLTGATHDGLATHPAVVFPGTSRAQSHKRYPPSHFAQAADLVAQRTGSPVVVAWGPGEEEMAGEVISSMKTPATLAPPMTLGQLTALIRRSRVFLAGDTGPMHIAWTIGTPVVAVYGPTDPVVNRPGGEHSAIAYQKVFCSPCRNRGCIARTCLENLPPENVAEAAFGVIRSAEHRKTPPLFETMGQSMSPSTRSSIRPPG
ncbi:MAG TPA: glycosyltransferase family 9 protein [Patescibacteria group bacterium]|nr:glycosyltransferase family 9 protein [Patescibacteria group bacterium]